MAWRIFLLVTRGTFVDLVICYRSYNWKDKVYKAIMYEESLCRE